MSSQPIAAPSADPSILTPVAEHEDLRDVVRAVVAKSGSPSRSLTPDPAARSHDTWKRLTAELEIGSLAVPESFGGAGFGLREVGVVLEETGATLLPEPVLMSTVVAVQALLMSSDPSDLLMSVASGREIATVAWPALVSNDVRAQVEGSTWILEGLVQKVPQVESARHLMLPAVTEGATALFAVDLEQNGVSVQPRTVLDETRSQGDVTIVSATATRLVAPADFAQAWATLTSAATIGVAAEHTGMMGHLLEITTTYLRERHQFGRAIASFQAIKHRLADLLVDLERARSASRYAAAVFDRDPEQAILPARIAAAICQDAVIRAAHEAVQLHGGIGFTWEHPAHLYVRRALGDEGLFGNSHAHRAAVAQLVGL